jgi:membrane protein DedA with SNARE-associated domain
MVLGAVLYSHLSWPPGFASRQAVIFFGMICGWLSGLLYKFLMKALLKKLGVKEEDVEKAVKKFETKPKVAGDIDDEDTPAETPSGKGA